MRHRQDTKLLSYMKFAALTLYVLLILPVVKSACHGQIPCIHTSWKDRLDYGCTHEVWRGEWINHDAKIDVSHMYNFSARYRSNSDAPCDITDISWLSPEIEKFRGKQMTDNTESHMLARLEHLYGKTLLMIGSSVDHRLTRNCEHYFGQNRVSKFFNFKRLNEKKYYPHFIDYCHIEELNFTIIYQVGAGLSMPIDRNDSMKVSNEFFLWNKASEFLGMSSPNYLLLGGEEWDFKIWKDEKISTPTDNYIASIINMRIDIAKKQWPFLEGIMIRNMYRADKYVTSTVDVTRYNQILRSIVIGRSNTLRRNKDCGGLFIADIAALMRNNGTKESGWTDGLHPAPIVSLNFLSLLMNILSDISAECINMEPCKAGTYLIGGFECRECR